MLRIDRVADKPIFDLGPLAEEDGLDIGLGGESSPTSARDLQQVRPHSHADNGKRSGLILTVAAIVIALGALVAVSLLTGDDPEPDAQRAEDLAEDGGASTRDAARGSDNDELGEIDAQGLAFEPPSAEHLRADEVASLFQLEIDGEGARYGIAYVAGDDLVVLDHRGITLPELEIAVDFATVSSLALLTTNGRTWAVDPVDRERNYLVSNSYVVVVSERPGTIAIIRPDNQTSIGLMSSALPIPSVELPEGAELLWAQGRGPLVMPRTGGTFEVSGTASSLTRISDDRAVAASLHGTVYESCDDSFSCVYVSQTDEEPVQELPFEPGTDFSVSPDGAWLIASTDTSVVLYDVRAGAELVASEQGVTAIDWSPDSSFVAIVDGDLLLAIYPETGEAIPIRLNHTPDQGSLLVFEG